MRTLLVIALAACGAYAAPLSGNSEVDLVQPRRVATAYSRAGSGYSPSSGVRPPVNSRDLLRSLFGAGFPSLVPRSDPNCDRGKFQLSDAVYDMVENCQRSPGAEQDLKQCIVSGLPAEATELKEFLDRDEYTIAGISSSFSIVIINGEVTQKHAVTFKLCPPGDEQNTVEETDLPRPQGRPTFANQPPFLNGPTLFGSARPTFQFPDVFSQQNPFLNFGDAFKPFFENNPSGMFPSFPNFDIDGTDVPTGYDTENCVRQTFQLPKEQFDKAQNCQYGDDPFKECLRKDLSDSEEAKELLQFVADEAHIVVGTRFYSSVSSINGKVTRKNKIQLQRCLRADDQAPEERAEQAPEPAAEQGAEQEAKPTPDLTHEPATEQEPYAGEVFEP